MRDAYEMPSFGGKIAILNCLILLGVFVSYSLGHGDPTVCRIVSWPMGLVIPSPYSNALVMFDAMLLVINSYLWGYAIAWVLSLIGKFIGLTSAKPVSR